MRRTIGVVGLLFAVVLTISACGGDSGQESGEGGTAPETTQTTAATETADKTKTAKTLPERPDQPLAPGKYVTDEFEPAFTFRLDQEGWFVFIGEMPGTLIAYQATSSSSGVLAFDNPQKVFDPQRLPETVAIPEPENWVAWFQDHPYFETTKPEPVSVGDVSGMRLDVTVASAPKDYPEECPVPCVDMYPLSDGTRIQATVGEPEPVIVLKIEGETVLIYVASMEGTPDKEYEEFVPKAQEVLDTVEWKAAP